MISKYRTAALLLSFIALGGCQSNPVEAVGESTTPGATAKPPAIKAPTGPNAITWTAPASFTVAESKGPMRIATYKIAKAEGDADDAELSVTQVGGDVTSNINRWKGQFDPAAEAEVNERAVGDLKVTVVNLAGTFKGMAMPGAPAGGAKENYAMLAAIVVWEGHGDPYFFKLTGPQKTVDAARPAFEELIGSFAHP